MTGNSSPGRHKLIFAIVFVHSNYFAQLAVYSLLPNWEEGNNISDFLGQLKSDLLKKKKYSKM